MNFKIREVKLKSGKMAVQVYTIANRKKNILKHLGSSVEYSETRYAKDKREMEKQVERARVYQDSESTKLRK